MEQIPEVFGVVFGSYYYAIQWFTSVGSKDLESSKQQNKFRVLEHEAFLCESCATCTYVPILNS
jgi:hypothetical protein